MKLTENTHKNLRNPHKNRSSHMTSWNEYKTHENADDAVNV